jgi:prepilin-type N-terminal cleavage/methylation domain-containing protein
MQSQKKSAGFSFIELVVVISILAILSTISFLSFSAYLTDARNSDRVSNIGEMKISLRAAKQRNGAYPIPGNKSTLTYS